MKEEFDNENSLPENLKGKNPFEVPETYFEKLHASVHDKIIRKKSPSWKKIFRPAFAIPALILVAALIFFFQKFSEKNIVELCADDLKNSSFLMNVEEYILMDYIAAQEENHSDYNIKQYLIENNIDITEIENEL
jgi:hypothetical protein